MADGGDSGEEPDGLGGPAVGCSGTLSVMGTSSGNAKCLSKLLDGFRKHCLILYKLFNRFSTGCESGAEPGELVGPLAVTVA